MPVPPGLLIDIAMLIAREVWRSRRRRTLPARTRVSTRPRASSRRLSPIGRLLRLTAIVVVLWLIWREVTRRRDALIAARRAASTTAAPPPMPPAAAPVPMPPPLPTVPGAPESREAASPGTPGEGGEAAQAASAEAVPPVSPAAPASPEAAAPPGTTGQGEEVTQSESVVVSDDADVGTQAICNNELIGWCARCREHYPMQQVTFTTNASGRRIARGVCLVCGTGIIRFVAHAQEADDSVS